MAVLCSEAMQRNASAFEMQTKAKSSIPYRAIRAACGTSACMSNQQTIEQEEASGTYL